ncbi:MAG: polymer-forming cytoskeletal protein [Candidatus Komeilibacteria bacterium]
MFAAKNSTEVNKKTVETFIGPSVRVEGDFTGEGDLIIEGTVVGNLVTNNNLRIGPGAVVEAEIKAKNAYVAGRVKGNVSIKGKLELTATAQIVGNVRTTVLSVESGGVINGQLNMAASVEKTERETAKPEVNKSEPLKERKAEM